MWYLPVAGWLRVFVFPLGQRMTSLSAEPFSPRPKCAVEGCCAVKESPVTNCTMSRRLPSNSWTVAPLAGCPAESVMCSPIQFPFAGIWFFITNNRCCFAWESYCTTRRSLRPSTSMSAVTTARASNSKATEQRRCGSWVCLFKNRWLCSNPFRNNLILARRVFRRKCVKGLVWLRCRCKHRDAKQCSNQGGVALRWPLATYKSSPRRCQNQLIRAPAGSRHVAQRRLLQSTAANKTDCRRSSARA